MHGIKDDREDSDGEEMEHESGESDKSSSSCDSSDAPSDSDDSSEMDEEECERRRTECMDNLVDLERQFTLLREQLYRERITQVDTKLGEVRCGRAQEYLQPLEELQENMRIRTEVAGVLREFRLTNIRNKFEAEELAASQNYESEKCLLWDSIHGDLEDKIRHLEEDRNNVDISADLWLVEQSYNSAGKIIRRGAGGTGKMTDSLNSSRKKPVTVSGPYIVYMLNDADILEDWTAIKKALSVSKRKSELHI
ncbi:Breast cancer metastasis-suppressor 1-like protein-A [Cryptotermes secundus]|uniref:Breast cancer metastasis-suppressor 1-like protein-A n=1 Tax=Cryptotermes secundus TaxID=105785 RepID=A0A2J7QLY4_9NEOP|nr:breast cancer metastasis-suppressor 1-like protein isoform X2 [Cryptotermes secundus]PNF29583.1 Breast cancer metastasis-suppressor 1-like protein-A [Cryptotermes secundus]